MCRWADKIGPNARTVVDRIFASVQIEEQAYNSVLAVLKLEKAYSREALEKACGEALKKTHSPRYRQLKSILVQMGRGSAPKAAKLPSSTSTKGLVRGAAYYGGDHHAEQ